MSGAITELELKPGPGLAGLEAKVVAAGSLLAPSRVPATISLVTGLWGLVALSSLGPHRAPEVSAGSPLLHHVGLEMEARAAVASGAALLVTGTLAEPRAAAGEDIGPRRSCARTGPRCQGCRTAGLRHRGTASHACDSDPFLTSSVPARAQPCPFPGVTSRGLLK